MYGIHDIPFEFANDKLSISIKEEAGLLIYRRHSPLLNEPPFQRAIVPDGHKVLIHPVEPVNQPFNQVQHLFVDFEPDFILAPKTSKKFFVTFPAEIGVFMVKAGSEEAGWQDRIDIISLAKKKLTLYGDISNGRICRHWKSGVFTEPPSTDPLMEYAVELNVANKTDIWLDARMTVFSAQQMKVYFGSRGVMLRATMSVFGDNMAETDFIDSPPMPDMKKAVELFRSRISVIGGSKFVMEWGV